MSTAENKGLDLRRFNNSGNGIAPAIVEQIALHGLKEAEELPINVAGLFYRLVKIKLWKDSPDKFLGICFKRRPQPGKWAQEISDKTLSEAITKVAATIHSLPKEAQLTIQERLQVLTSHDRLLKIENAAVRHALHVDGHWRRLPERRHIDLVTIGKLAALKRAIPRISHKKTDSPRVAIRH